MCSVLDTEKFKLLGFLTCACLPVFVYLKAYFIIFRWLLNRVTCMLSSAWLCKFLAWTFISQPHTAKYGEKWSCLIAFTFLSEMSLQCSQISICLDSSWSSIPSLIFKWIQDYYYIWQNLVHAMQSWRRASCIDSLSLNDGSSAHQTLDFTASQTRALCVYRASTRVSGEPDLANVHLGMWLVIWFRI